MSLLHTGLSQTSNPHAGAIAKAQTLIAEHFPAALGAGLRGGQC